MKKIVLGLAAVAVIATSGMAEDINFDVDKGYVTAGLALEMVDEYDMGVAAVIGGGIPFMQAGGGTLVAEAELTYSVISPSWDYDFGYYGGKGSVDATFMTLATYAGWQYNFNQELFIKPRVGLIYRSVDIDIDGYDGSDSEIGLALGVQGGMKLSEAFDVTVGLNLVDGSDIIHITGGVQYHF